MGGGKLPTQSGAKLPNLAERSCRVVKMVVLTDSHRTGDQAQQTCQRNEGAKWIKVEPSKAELPSQANLPNWEKSVLDCGFTD